MVALAHVVCQPAKLPSVANCPVSLVFMEVVSHPAGGWTIAEPIDATTGTRRIYRGRWSSKRAARAALESKFSYHAR